MRLHTTMNNAQPAPIQPEPTDSAQLSRGDFLRSLGLSGAALMAFYCMGTLSSCSGGGDDPAPSTPTPAGNGVTGNASTAGGAISFTLDLTNSTYTGLKTVGQTAKVGDVFIANTSSGFVALSRYCTHQGQDALVFQSNSNTIRCTVHGSVFSNTGAVVNGPAASPLIRYTTTVSADGNTLTVRA